MNKSSSSRRFSMGGARSAPAALDPADLGTAFGLEASLEQQDPRPGPTVASAAQAGWWRRLTTRARTRAVA